MSDHIKRLSALLAYAAEAIKQAESVLDEEAEAQEPKKTDFSWGQRSISRMDGIHDDLRKVFMRAIEITPIDLVVIEGMRSKERQRELYRKGASKTMNSRHLTGHAIDVAPLDGGQVSWEWPLYYRIAEAIKQAAKDVGVTIEWGGDWNSFKDGPHWQLPWKEYPA